MRYTWHEWARCPDCRDGGHALRSGPCNVDALDLVYTSYSGAGGPKAVCGQHVKATRACSGLPGAPCDVPEARVACSLPAALKSWRATTAAPIAGSNPPAGPPVSATCDALVAGVGC